LATPTLRVAGCAGDPSATDRPDAIDAMVDA
jgi:hypothetical protein